MTSKTVITQNSTVKNLGVTFDSTLSFDQHIKEMTTISFYQLRSIAENRSYLTTPDSEIPIHAFVSSRLDYCNALLSGLPLESTKSLQMVQNAAARVLSCTRKCDHITPSYPLHWLPINIRSDFKVLLMTYKTVRGLAPIVDADICSLIKREIHVILVALEEKTVITEVIRFHLVN